jgi:hypothetical protein
VNVPARIDPELLLPPEPELSPSERLESVQVLMRSILNSLGHLRADIAGSEAMSRDGERHCRFQIEAARNCLEGVYGVVQLLRDGNTQTIADFGRVDSKAPF